MRWERVSAMPGFGAAAWKTAPRDRFIGWDPPTRQRRLPLVVNHARHLTLPWIRPCLASHLLACLQRQLPEDWQQRYALRPVLLETFCEIPRFQGMCHRAANWIHLGRTLGRGNPQSIAPQPFATDRSNTYRWGIFP